MAKTTAPHSNPTAQSAPGTSSPHPPSGENSWALAEAAGDVALAPIPSLEEPRSLLKLLKTWQVQSPEEKSRNATHLPVLPMLRGGHSRASEQEQPASCFYFPLIFSAIPAPPRSTSTCFRSAGILPASAAWSGGTGNPVFCFSTLNVFSS